jgi:CubicO group peptidase (beta-lactamase class C family)
MTDNVNFASITDQIQLEMKRLHIPGVAIGILDNDREFTAGFGVTNSENPLQVTPDTLFQIGSVTKTVTATVMMRLVERGLVDLDTPLRRYLPELRLSDQEVLERVTLRHVFSHTCGWVGDFFDDAGPGDDALSTVVSRLDGLEQQTPLGEIWSYNNAGYYLAGRVIEVLTGMTYEAAVRELLLNPLGMDRSFFFAREAITYRVSAGHEAVYQPDEGIPGVLRPWWLPRASNPLGGLLSTIHDLIRYALFHLGDGRTQDGARLLEEKTISAMQSPGVPASNGERMGIAWFLRELDGIRIARHGGATNGQMALFQIVPQKKFAFIMLTNSDRGQELYQPLARKALESFLGLKESEPQPVSAGEAELAQYVGDYSAAAQNLHLTFEKGFLHMRVEPRGGFPTPDSPPSPAPPPTRLQMCGKDTVLATDEPFKGDRGEFLRDKHGSLVWLRFSGRVHRKISGNP